MSTLTTQEAKRGIASRRVAVLALTTLVSTILLILVGSIVRVTGYGLGCPDWPLCYGQPIPPFVVGAWFEFTHRLVGLIASVQIVALGLIGWQHYKQNPWLRRPALAALILLVLQIPLGGIHVLLEIPPVTGLIHTAFALAIVGLIALMFAVLHPITRALRESGQTLAARPRLVTWVSVTAALTYVLLLTGSLVTRTGASLACPAFPWCGVTDVPWHSLIWIQMLHRYTAFTVTFFILVTVYMLLRHAPNPSWRRFAYLLVVVLVTQFTLGVLNVWLRIPIWTRALHLTVGATLWVLVVVLWTTLWLATRPEAELQI